MRRTRTIWLDLSTPEPLPLGFHLLVTAPYVALIFWLAADPAAAWRWVTLHALACALGSWFYRRW